MVGRVMVCIVENSLKIFSSCLNSPKNAFTITSPLYFNSFSSL